MKYLIPTYKKASFMKKIAILNRRAEKVGAPDIEVEYGAVSYVETETKDYGKIKVPVVEVEVEGFTPTYNGWSIISRFTHESGVTISNTINGMMPPEEYRNIKEPFCDHCKTKRVKKYSTLIYNPEVGYKVVGRSCLTNFVDKKLEEQLSFYERFAEFANEIEETYNLSGAGIYDFGFETREIVALSNYFIRTDGYMSVAASYENNVSPTKDLVAEVALNRSKKPTLMDRDYEAADAALEWIKNAETNNEFMLNLKAMASLENLPLKGFGFLSALIPSYERSLRKAEEVAGYKQEYIGSLKERREFNVELIFKTSYETMYGTTVVYSMLDEENRLVTWKATASLSVNDPETNSTVYMEVGDKFKMVGTIKEHSEYRDNKVTYVNRCKVTDGAAVLERYKKDCEEEMKKYA